MLSLKCYILLLKGIRLRKAIIFILHLSITSFALYFFFIYNFTYTLNCLLFVRKYYNKFVFLLINFIFFFFRFIFNKYNNSRRTTNTASCYTKSTNTTNNNNKEANYSGTNSNTNNYNTKTFLK